MERFKECRFNPLYLIGDNGTVKSLDARSIKRSENKDGVLLGLVKADGYKMYWLAKKWYYAHRLVAMHYCRNPNNWIEVNHIDGVKDNNYYKNLEWSTRKLNQIHMRYVLGKIGPRGKDHWNYGVSPSDKAKKLMSEAKKGINHPRFKGYYVFGGIKYATPNDLAMLRNVSQRTIRRSCKEGINGYSFELK